MATERTSILPDGTVVFLDANKDAMLPSGVVVSMEDLGGAPPAGFKPAWAMASSRANLIGAR